MRTYYNRSQGWEVRGNEWDMPETLDLLWIVRKLEAWQLDIVSERSPKTSATENSGPSTRNATSTAGPHRRAAEGAS